jgi:hypothetical protein
LEIGVPFEDGEIRNLLQAASKGIAYYEDNKRRYRKCKYSDCR